VAAAVLLGRIRVAGGMEITSAMNIPLFSVPDSFEHI
jgi:hypothetical protein